MSKELEYGKRKQRGGLQESLDTSVKITEKRFKELLEDKDNEYEYYCYDDRCNQILFCGKCELQYQWLYIQLPSEYEAIKNAEPTKAMECLERLGTWELANSCMETVNESDDYDTIKQALIKAQEKEKEKLLFKNIHNTKVKTPLVAIFEGLSKDERFKFIEHIYYHWEEMKEALEEQNEQLTKEIIELKKKLNKPHITWKDLTFSKEPTYIKATLNNVVVTLECWLEGKKEWCRANFNNAPCNNIVFVHHGYDDETDTQTTIFDALGFNEIEKRV